MSEDAEAGTPYYSARSTLSGGVMVNEEADDGDSEEEMPDAVDSKHVKMSVLEAEKKQSSKKRSSTAVRRQAQAERIRRKQARQQQQQQQQPPQNEDDEAGVSIIPPKVLAALEERKAAAAKPHGKKTYLALTTQPKQPKTTVSGALITKLSSTSHHLAPANMSHASHAKAALLSRHKIDARTGRGRRRFNVQLS